MEAKDETAIGKQVNNPSLEELEDAPSQLEPQPGPSKVNEKEGNKDEEEGNKDDEDDEEWVDPNPEKGAKYARAEEACKYGSGCFARYPRMRAGDFWLKCVRPCKACCKIFDVERPERYLPTKEELKNYPKLRRMSRRNLELELYSSTDSDSDGDAKTGKRKAKADANPRKAKK